MAKIVCNFGLSECIRVKRQWYAVNICNSYVATNLVHTSDSFVKLNFLDNYFVFDFPGTLGEKNPPATGVTRSTCSTDAFQETQTRGRKRGRGELQETGMGLPHPLLSFYHIQNVFFHFTPYSCFI